MTFSPTGLPLCPTCGRLRSQHTNPIAHAFGAPYKMVRDRPARSGGPRTDFGRHFRLGLFVRGAAKPAAWHRIEAQANGTLRKFRASWTNDYHDAADPPGIPG